MKISIKILIILITMQKLAYSETYIDEDINIYQIKLILISHNPSNYIEYEENFKSSIYLEKKNITINKNNCLINNDGLCEKYNSDYKLDNFNDYIKALNKDSDINVVKHIEWLQEIKEKKYIKIKAGYDYSEDIFNDQLEIKDINILSSGKITKYEGDISILKKEFYQVSFNINERKKMKPPGFFSNEVLVSKNYKITQKIKLNKITYIDRDDFGIIIKISKVKEM
tara:strand:- start:1067 stop:1744 length:678 start_codon:yes stop_codon:yes gene_type:complete